MDAAQQPAGPAGRQAGGLAIARFASAAIQATSWALVARAVTAGEFAVFAAVLGAVSLLVVCADAGATPAVLRHHADSGVTWRLDRLNRSVAFAVAAGPAAALTALAAARDSTLLAATVPLGAWIYVERRAEFAATTLLARGDTRTTVAATLVRRLPAAVAVILVSGAAAHEVLAFGVGSLVGGAAGLALLRRHPLTPRKPTGELVGRPPVAPYWWASVGQQVRQLDVALLAVVAGGPTAAAWALSSRLIPPFRLFPTTFAQVLLARLPMTGDERGARTAIARTVATSGTVYVVAAATTRWWVPAAFGSQHAGAATATSIMLLGLIPAAYASNAMSLLQGRDQPVLVAAVAWLSAVVGLAAIALLAVSFGAEGAAAGTAVMFSAQAALLTAALARPRAGAALRQAVVA